MDSQDGIYSELHEAARAWAQAGFYVFPCVVNGKEPACAHGHNDATTDLDQIDRWWTENPAYNIGISPARSSMFVLDVDPPRGSETLAALASVHGPLPTTMLIRTPRGGLHYWFQGSCRSSTNTVGPNLDTRGEGGYVLVPPSFVIDTRKGINGPYTYEGETDEIAEGPSWIRTLLASRPETHTATDSIEFDNIANVDRAISLLQFYASNGDVATEGQGGDARTYQVACEILNLGLSVKKAHEVIADEWNPHCRPPWDRDELLTKIENAARYAQNEAGAWAVPPVAELFATAAATLKPQPEKVSPFRPLSMAELAKVLRPPAWIIPGIIQEQGVIQIIGKQKSFKTFLTLDMAMSIAAGEETFGHRPESRPVIYTVGENASTFGLAHMPAWRLAHQREDNFPFFVIPTVPKAFFSDQCAELVRETRKVISDVALLVIDTSTRAMRGLDENSAKDMGLFSEMCDQIKRELGCTVAVVRHTGKDSAKGGRGSNVLDGDFDGTMEVIRREERNMSEWWVREVRNAAEPEHPFVFEGSIVGPSLVFNLMTREAVRNLDSDIFAPHSVGATLRSLGCFGEAKGISTRVLAEALCAPIIDETTEKRSRLVDGFERKLAGLAKDRLEAYAYGEGRGRRWYL